MERRSYFQYSPSRVHTPLQRSSSLMDGERYLTELLAERQKLGPFLHALPVCSRLLNQEIVRVSGMLSSQLNDQERIAHEYPLSTLERQLSGGQFNTDGWNAQQTEENRLLQKIAHFQNSPVNWPVVSGFTPIPIVKRVVRLDVPVDKFPHYNFVGRILGPRGNSLKRVESLTECRIYIRGRGSVKDTLKEEKLKDKPGYEHLNEPLHLLLEAEFPEEIIDARLEHAMAVLENLLKPVDESTDIYKKQQLRELAIINGTLREESPRMSPTMSPSMSPFNSTGMKRAKTGR